MDYIQALKSEGRDSEIPRYVVVSDFALIALHDLETGESVEFPLAEFHGNVDHFAFIPATNNTSSSKITRSTSRLCVSWAACMKP